MRQVFFIYTAYNYIHGPTRAEQVVVVIDRPNVDNPTRVARGGGDQDDLVVVARVGSTHWAIIVALGLSISS